MFNFLMMNFIFEDFSKIIWLYLVFFVILFLLEKFNESVEFLLLILLKLYKLIVVVVDVNVRMI